MEDFSGKEKLNIPTETCLVSAPYLSQRAKYASFICDPTCQTKTLHHSYC